MGKGVIGDSRITGAMGLFDPTGMFFVFAVWALAGFAYPSTPFPIAMNMLSKIVAFAVAISLFLRDWKQRVFPARPRGVTIVVPQ